jgi:hypothetical protein
VMTNTQQKQYIPLSHRATSTSTSFVDNDPDIFPSCFKNAVASNDLVPNHRPIHQGESSRIHNTTIKVRVINERSRINNTTIETSKTEKKHNQRMNKSQSRRYKNSTRGTL